MTYSDTHSWTTSYLVFELFNHIIINHFMEKRGAEDAKAWGRDQKALISFDWTKSAATSRY